MIDKVTIVTNVQQAYQPKVKGGRDVAKTEKSDRVEVSKAAKTALTREEAVKVVRNAPDVRASKVAEARRKLETGELLTDKVIEAIAEKLAESIGF